MCIILDASKFGEFLKLESDDMRPIKNWVEREGRIAYSPTGKIQAELNKSRRMKKLFAEYRSRGKIKFVKVRDVENIQRDLTNIKSNDPHIIALALAGDAKLLVSEDKDLQTDFGKHIPRGKTYKNKTHKHLLSGYSCP